MMVLKECSVIFLITMLSAHLSSSMNFEHVQEDDLSLQEFEEPRTIYRTSLENGKEHKFEIQMRLGNGVTVGCEVEKRATYEDITELYLEDEFGRREPEMGEDLPHAKYRTTHSIFTRHPEATADLLEMEVPYGWWPAECIQRIMGLSFENTLCNCPSGPPGLTGRPGPEGPSGPTGPPGNDGRNGTDGSTGPEGDQGPPGPPGNKGGKGAPGSPGLAGGPGPQGPPGNPGRDGRDGVSGPKGAPGQNGKPGKDGRNGRNGRDGLQGPPGEAGIPGVAGVAGIPGEQGLQGIPAPSGSSGQPGVNGPPGIPGRPGENGPCGWTSGSNPGWGWGADPDNSGVQITDNEDPSDPSDPSENSDPPVGENGWTQDPAIGMDHEPTGDNGWGSSDTTYTNPNVTPAKPAQSAQGSYQSIADMNQQSGINRPAPSWGPNPYVPVPPPVPSGPVGTPQNPNPFATPLQQSPQGLSPYSDKRPDYPVSQSFQGANPLWGSPQFQGNLGMLQSYGNSNYWKNSGTRSVNRASGGSGGVKSKPCPIHKTKGKNKVRRPSAVKGPMTDSTSKVDIEEVLKEDIKNAPPRARVDLDVLEEDDHRSMV